MKSTYYKFPDDSVVIFPPGASSTSAELTGTRYYPHSGESVAGAFWSVPEMKPQRATRITEGVARALLGEHFPGAKRTLPVGRITLADALDLAARALRAVSASSGEIGARTLNVRAFELEEIRNKLRGPSAPDQIELT